MAIKAKELKVVKPLHKFAQESHNFGGSQQILKAFYEAFVTGNKASVTLHPDRIYKVENEERGVVFKTEDLDKIKTLTLTFEEIGRMRFDDNFSGYAGETIMAYEGADKEHPGISNDKAFPSIVISTSEVQLREEKPSYSLNLYKKFNNWQWFIGTQGNDEDDAPFCNVVGKPNELDSQNKFGLFNERIDKLIKGGLKKELHPITSDEEKEDDQQIVYPKLTFKVKELTAYTA